MNILKCDFCGNIINLETNMPPTPGITFTTQTRTIHYDCCKMCMLDFLEQFGKVSDMEYLYGGKER